MRYLIRSASEVVVFHFGEIGFTKAPHHNSDARPDDISCWIGYYLSLDVPGFLPAVWTVSLQPGALSCLAPLGPSLRR